MTLSYDSNHFLKRDEKIEDGRDAFLYYREKNSGWLLTHGEDFYSKNGASWFIAKTEGLKLFSEFYVKKII